MIITEKKTKSLSLNSFIQFAILAIISSSIGYFTARYYRYRNYHNYAQILDENDLIKGEYKNMEKVFNDLSSQIDKVNEYLGVVEEIKNKENSEKNDKTESKDIGMISKAEQVFHSEGKQTSIEMADALNKKMLLAYGKINERNSVLSSYIKKLGLSNIRYNHIIKVAKISSSNEDVDNYISNVYDESSIGGEDENVKKILYVKQNKPFLKIVEGKINNNNYKTEIDKSIDIEKTFSYLPFGIPSKSSYRTTSTYGFRYDPILNNNNLQLHRGIDIVISDGAIITPKEGKVIFAGQKQGYGLCVDIEHSNNHNNSIITHYAHLSKILVKVGQEVKKNDLIGIQGASGRATGDHLHYEIRINGQTLNPVGFMKGV